MENIELYIIAGLIFAIVLVTYSTWKYYRGEKKNVKDLHRFAKQGEVDAQSKLAKRYQEGNMVKKDCQKAAFWYQSAAFLGDEDSKGHLKNFVDTKKK